MTGDPAGGPTGDPVGGATGPAEDDLDPRVRARRLHQRCTRFERAIADRLATTTVARPYGVLRTSPDTRPLYSTNHVEVTRPVAVAELLADVGSLAAEHDLAHRRIITAVPEVAWVLAPALADRGWAAERFVTMVHDGLTRPAVSPVDVGPVALGAWLPFQRAVLDEVPWGRDPAVQAARERRDRRIAERVDVTWVLAGDGSGGCHVYRHGAVAQIEELDVLAEHRGRGVGTAVLAAAMHACEGAATTFLVADADDWPRRWYARLGFRPVGSGWAWLLRPTNPAGGG